MGINIKKLNINGWVFVTIILIVLAMRGPTLIEHFRQEGIKLIPVALNGKPFPPYGTKSVLVFWTSWCGPCSIELSRIHTALLNKEIAPANIYAVNLGESEDIVNKVIQERKFKIAVVRDNLGLLANLLNIRATPSIAFIDELGIVKWVSSGLSPTLIYRIKYFLKD